MQIGAFFSLSRSIETSENNSKISVYCTQDGPESQSKVFLMTLVMMVRLSCKNTVSRRRVQCSVLPIQISNSSLDTHKNYLIIHINIDMNIDILKNNPGANDYQEIIETNGYKILNKISEEDVNRKTDTTATIIDHIITKHNNKNEYNKVRKDIVNKINTMEDMKDCGETYQI